MIRLILFWLTYMAILPGLLILFWLGDITIEHKKQTFR